MKPETARRMVALAVKQGKLIRPESCQRCGDYPGKASDGRAMIQGHHPDYSKPLDVEWICCKCHREETPLPVVMGGKAIGSVNGQAKLTEDDVIKMRSMRAKGMSYVALGAHFGINHTSARRACVGEQWAQIPLAASQPEVSE